MDRRTFVKGTAAAVGASTLPGRVFAQAAAPDKIRFGYAITQSGPLGPGAESTSISQYKLWQKRVNDAGGIMLKKFNKKVPIEFVSYDDQGKPDELLKLTERLIQQDKVDMMLGPYATHMNLAAAPIVNKYEYPVIMTTATTTKTYTLGPKWPYAFWNISQPKESTEPMSRALARLKVTSSPSSRIRPLVGSSSPAIMRSVVVLPQPDGPSSARNSPSCTVKVESSTAAKSPNCLRRFSTLISAMATPETSRRR